MHSALIASLTASRVVTDVGHSLREGFYMFWDTLWALVLGFGLSGAVQAFASRSGIRRRLGDHRPGTVVRAAAYGMVSSSCSYAASAMAKSLFVGGADYVASMVFLVASTNLVFELGIVLLVLIGWQFLAGELVGSVVMIGLLVAAGSLCFRGRSLAEARSVAAGGRDPDPADHGGAGDRRQGWRQRAGSRAAWTDAASHTVSDLTMLRREMIVGFVVAGFLAVMVPSHVWNDVFLHGHGFWTSLENVIVGPLVAMISFVCSIGNVPLAAALWKGGVTFGGVASFLFADLISMPLLLTYRKQYGGRMTLRLLGVFWGVMSIAGLTTEYLFRALGWVPTGRPTVIAGDALSWNYTTILDIIALIGFGGLYWLHGTRERFGGSSVLFTDPICGMQVETASAPASTERDGRRLFFCSERCLDRFVAIDEGGVKSSRGVGRPPPDDSTVSQSCPRQNGW